jgi:hypothetical protein
MRSTHWLATLGALALAISACATGAGDTGSADVAVDATHADTPDVGPDGCTDEDGDGAGIGDACAITDCNDGDSLVHPGADEVPYDGLDNDCDLSTPDDDLDGDGYLSDLDCDDADPEVHPGQGEVPFDGKDNDCDDATGDDDGDGDGYGIDDDCDDEDANVHPGATEVAYDGADNDCDPSTPDDDLDGDGFGLDEDCDDEASDVSPAQLEAPYDGLDNDCDPSTPDDDLDGDGFGIADDCDDTDDSVYPGADEISYDGKDNDCDPSTLDEDADGDGVLGDEDCDDEDGDVYPGADEVADGKDNDCDGDIDEGTVAADDDGDGYCEGWEVAPDALACSDGSSPGDCDDEDAWLTPGDLDGDGTSTCDGDCDDGDAALNPSDADGDGVSTCALDCDDSNPAITLLDADGDGFVACDDDCDDGAAEVNPDAAEIYYNDVDDDCDAGTVDDDQDGDGWGLADDCDDTDPNVHPWAVEIPDNGEDEDCDGLDVTAFDGDELDDMAPDEGVIPEDGMLVMDFSPYLLTGDIVVPLGKTLIIAPGVELHFMGPFKVLVHGTLVVLGTEGEPVLFTSGVPGATKGAWQGIHFETTGTGLVRGAVIEYANHGVRADEATLQISHTTARYCDAGVHVTGTSASPSLDHLVLTENTVGLELSWAGWSGDVFVNYSLINQNQTGITGTGSSGLILWNSEVIDNSGVGVFLDGATLWHNTIAGNDTGLVTQGGWDTCTRSIIEANDVGVLLGSYPTRFSSNHNNIIDNLSYGFVYDGGNDDGAVNAEFNWWGSMLGGDIAATIWDFFDDTALYYVDYIPFLRSSVDSVGPIPEGTIDADGDHFFSVASGGNDCDDGNAAIHPDALDDQLDGIDDDCDGQFDEDAPLDTDGDGFTIPEDCDNEDATIYPDATEIPNNGVDENCNGFDMVTATEADLSGVLPSDVLLTAANSPYIITGDLYVAPDFVLRLEAGTEVRFDGYWSVIVFGDLFADGEAGAPVSFRSHSGATGAGQWNRIWINDIGGGYLHHTIVEDATTAVYVEDTSIDIVGGMLRGSDTGLMVDGTSATVLVEHTMITENTTGVNASWSGWSQDSRLRYVTIAQNTNGITTSGSAGVDLWSCIIEGNTGVGLQADGGSFRHNLFVGNGTAITTQGGWDTITHNIFDANDVGVQVGNYPDRPQIHFNAFVNQQEYAMTYVGGGDGAPVSADHNWWNTNVLMEIREATWDIYDDPNLFPILVQPFLGQMPLSVGPVPEGDVDADGDGFYSEASGGNDCDDTQAAKNPDAADDDGDGDDDDCDGVVDDEVLVDLDGDGSLSDMDCDDDNGDIHPGASEIANNGVDEDCNGTDLTTLPSGELGGVLPGDTLLTQAESPYVITEDLYILPDTLLLIEDSAEVLFADGVGIIDKGDLVVGDEVMLLPVGDWVAGAWKGIRVEGTGWAQIGAAYLVGATIGVEIIDTSASIAGTSITDCGTGIRIDGTEATASITNANISDNGTGIMGSWCAWSGSVDVVDSAITENGNGILTTGSANVNVIGSFIDFNTGVGFSMDGNSLQQSIVYGNGIGIQTSGGWDDIYDNDISDNGIGLQLGSYPQRPEILGNNITGNTEFALVYVGGNGDGPVNAAGNWWGSADAADISEMIWDLYDDTELFEVVFDPPLTESNPDAGPSWL